MTLLAPSYDESPILPGVISLVFFWTYGSQQCSSLPFSICYTISLKEVTQSLYVLYPKEL